jgi:hypothetical protein
MAEMFRTLATTLFLLLASGPQQPAPAPQSPGASSPAVPSSPENDAGAKKEKKEKKVWTNDNLSDVKGPVSVVGGAAGKAPAGSKAVDPGYVAEAKKKLEKLWTDMAVAGRQIAKLREFNAGEPVGTSDREFHKGYNMQPVDQQIAALEAKKRDLQAKIDLLLDEARKKGVEPGQLR